MFRKSILTPLFSFLCLFFLSNLAFAQGTTTRITGTVTDNSGAAVAGASVTLTNEATNITLTTTTSDSGNYTFDLIQVGTYQVSVEKQGFKKFVSTGNTANVNQPATVNVALEIGDVSATVTVEGSVEQVQTSSSGNIGSTIEQKTLESLPIVGTRGRNPLELLNFQPGVVNGANTGGGVHVNGSRDRSFNFTLDGIDINESSAGGSNFVPLRSNPDSLQEFQIVTSGFTAELGRSSGAQVTLVTKSGTNQFRGNVFEFYQTPRFNATTYGNNLNGRAKDQFVQHIFGGSFGGPIIKDKFFFFTNLQLLRAYDTALVTRTVYTSTARQGIYRYVQGGTNTAAGAANSSVDGAGSPLRPACGGSITTNCINSYTINGLNSNLMSVIRAMPLPNNFSAGDGLNTAGFSFGSPQREKQYDFVSKFDYKFSDSNVIYVRYAQGNQTTFGDNSNGYANISGGGGRPVFPDGSNLVDTYRKPKNLAANWRLSPTATFTNEFIFGYSKAFYKFNTTSPDPSIPYIFNLPVTPSVNLAYDGRSFRTIQLVDNMTFDYSPHILKVGVNFRFGNQIDDRSSRGGSLDLKIEPYVDFSRSVNNNFSGFGLPSSGIDSNDRIRLESAINDMVGRVGNYNLLFISDPNDPSRFAPVGTRWNFKANYPEYDFYAQDTWKFLQNLTVDLGVRWEVKLTPRSAGERPIVRPDAPFTLGSAPSNTLRWVAGDLFKSDFSKILPSVGFAWDPFKTGKTSLRANYRMASDRFGTQLFSSSIFIGSPGLSYAALNQSYGQNGGLYGAGVSSLPVLTPPGSAADLSQPPVFSGNSINLIDPDLVFPRIHSWTVSLQREIWKNNVLEVNYIGKKGTHLFGGYDSNQVNINATAAGFFDNFLTEFNRVRANSSYNSPLINALYTGNANNNTGTATFRSTNTANITQGNIASAALSISQRTCSASDVTAGICSAAGTQLIASTIRNPFFFQKYPQFTGGLQVIDSNDFSFYNALELIFKRRISSGLGFQFGYTLAKSMDTRSFDPVFTTVSRGSSQSSANTPFDNNNRRLNYAWSDFDRRHSFQGTYTYELPFGKGRKLFSDSPTVVDYIIGGWQLSGNVVLTSGRPFTVYANRNTVSNVVQTTANCNNCSRDLGKLIQESGTTFFFDTAARGLFSTPGPGELGNTGRNYFIGPRFFQTDASLSKNFRLTERFNFDLRVDARNLTNSVSFDLPNAILGGTAPFGRIRDSVTNASRRIQFSGKLNF